MVNGIKLTTWSRCASAGADGSEFPIPLALCQYTPDKRPKKITSVKKMITKTTLVRIDKMRKTKDRIAMKTRKKANEELKSTVSRPANSGWPAGAYNPYA